MSEMRIQNKKVYKQKDKLYNLDFMGLVRLWDGVIHSTLYIKVILEHRLLTFVYVDCISCLCFAESTMLLRCDMYYIQCYIKSYKCR